MKSDSTRRTSIDLPKTLYTKLKAEAIRNDKTLRDLTIEAISEKLVRESIEENERTKDLINSKFALAVIDLISEYTTEPIATTLLIEKCSLHNVAIQSLKPRNLTQELIADIVKSLNYILNQKIVEKIRSELLEMSTGGI